jgi:hypothetical protein
MTDEQNTLSAGPLSRSNGDGTGHSAPKSRFVYDQDRNEPYVPLPGFPHLRITPLRHGDEEAQAVLYSIESVGKWALRRPYP